MLTKSFRLVKALQNKSRFFSLASSSSTTSSESSSIPVSSSLLTSSSNPSVRTPREADVIPARKLIKPRKRPTQMQRPTEQLKPLVAIHPQNRSIYQTAPDRVKVVDAIGAVAAAELAKSIGLVDAKTSNNYGKKGKAPTTSSSKKSLKDSSSSGSVDSGSGSDSEGGPIIDVAGGGKSGSGSSSSSSSSTSSGGSSSSSSGDNSPSSSSSAGSSGSEAMGPVRIVSTTESSSASASSGGGSSSEGNDGTPSTALTIASKSKSGEKISQSGLEGWRANLEQRRARGRLTETEKKARERAILALSLNFPSAAAASSSSSSPSSSSSSSSSLPQLFAIISLAGKQFKVSPGDIVIADRLKNVAVANELALSPHIVGSPTTTIVGRPVVQGASVMCVVESHELDEKVIVFKKKRRKRYQRTQGHRREISRIRIDKIVCDVSAY